MALKFGPTSIARPWEMANNHQLVSKMIMSSALAVKAADIESEYAADASTAASPRDDVRDDESVATTRYHDGGPGAADAGEDFADLPALVREPREKIHSC